jgi:hypothetical protein
MVKAWLVRLELARDDDGPLSDEGIAGLTERLTQDHVQPLLTPRDLGTVEVQLSVEATNEMAARSAAQGILRDRAQEVWLAHGLPPFTITVLDATPEAGS